MYYEFDKSDIKSDQRARIEANAKYLRDNPSAKVTVTSSPRRLWAFVRTLPSAMTTPEPRWRVGNLHNGSRSYA